MKKRLFSRLTALALTVLTVAALAVPAFAVEPIEVNEDISVSGAVAVKTIWPKLTRAQPSLAAYRPLTRLSTCVQVSASSTAAPAPAEAEMANLRGAMRFALTSFTSNAE